MATLLQLLVDAGCYTAGRLTTDGHTPNSADISDARALNAAAEELEHRATQLSVCIDRLAIACEFPRPELDRRIEALLRAGRRLRECLHAGAQQLDEPSPIWSDQAELRSEVTRIGDRLAELAQRQGRRRVEALAHELRAATVSHRVEARRRRLEQLRASVVTELGDADTAIGSLPWPTQDEPSWVRWILCLEDPAATQAYDAVSQVFPSLHELLESLDQPSWIYPGMTSSAPLAPPSPIEARADRPSAAAPADDGLADAPARGLVEEGPMPVAPLLVLEDEWPAAEPQRGSAAEPSPPVPLTFVPEEGPTPEESSAPEAATVVPEAVGLAHEPTSHPTDEATPAAPPAPPVAAKPPSQAADVATAGAPAPHCPAADDPTNDRPAALAVTGAAPAAGPAAPDPDARMLAATFPEALRSLKSFRHAFWRDGSGTLVSAPWLTADFPELLERAATEALRRRAFNHLIVFCRCAHVLGIPTLPTREDLNALLAIFNQPDGPVPNGGETRVEALLEEERRGEPRTTLRHQILIFVAALCACPEHAELAPSIVSIIREAGLAGSTVATFFEAALRLGLEAENPIARLRAELRKAPLRTSAELEAEVVAGETNLRARLKQLHSAAGGRVQRTHCRRAWEEFMFAAKPVFDSILAGSTDLRPVDELLDTHDRIADHAGAKYQDRNAMDRSARQLSEAGRRIVVARRELSRQKKDQPTLSLANLVAAYRGLNEHGGRADGTFVSIVRDLASASAEALAAQGSVVFTKQDFLQIPALLETIPVVATDEDPITVDAWSIVDPISAAAHLITGLPGHALPLDIDLLAHLREQKREDLLVHVSPVSKADTTRAQEALQRANMALHHALNAAQRDVNRMRQVAHPATPVVLEAVQAALAAVEDASSGEIKPEVLSEWMNRVAAFATAAVARSIDSIRDRFARLSPPPTRERQDHFQQALDRDRLAEARALANGENLPPSEEGERATMWRRIAVQSFDEPRRILRHHRGEPSELIQAWLGGLREEARDDELRRLFVAFVFAGQFTPGATEKSRTSTISSVAVRAWIAKERLNPSFVPQLTAFKEIALITAPVPPTADSFVRQTAETVARAPAGRIIVVLAPAITRPVRETLREDLRRRSARGYAIIDDIDFARLVNPGGQQPNVVLGLLEIVMEQQPTWSSVNPFELSEGQHTKPEMFVGREDEAAQLATRAQFSRLFSGRKLGKSALLKHVRDTQRNVRLPSGNELTVLYVPVVGLDSESLVVERIANCFASELDHSPVSPSGDPLERLKDLVTSYLKRKRTKSLLVFLDEADMFVEAQIRDYEVRREKCLTWLMRTDLEAQRDSMELPRIRFVFAGYRATHRNEAAWANWGDVLRLEPLSIDAATRLAKGPLARLGIDTNDEAATMAYLCGYQPAVIVQFGRRLVEHLDATYGPARREAVVVRSEDVAIAYQSSDVQNEIRTIVWHNFVGNPFGRVVFAVMLLEFARLAPAVPLDDAPERILGRLREIVPGALADSALEGPPGERIARELRGFIERSLLHQVDAATQSYALRFPHHLTILLQDVQEATIRREAGELGDSSGAESRQEIRTLLPRVGLLDLGEALTIDGVVGAVATSHWTASLIEGAANVPDRLGFRPDDVFDALDSPDGGAGMLRRPRVAVTSATPETAERVLAARSELPRQPRPLFVGGLDLLRWAIHNRHGAHELELASVARLTVPQLRWWFERIRAIEFAGPSPTRQFLEFTSGVPFLVGLLDRVLETEVGFDGTNATEDQVRRVIASCREKFQKHAIALVSGDPSVRLDRREAELLVMVHSASQTATNGAELLEMLTNPEEWQEVFPWAADHRLALRTGDDAHVELLLRTGVLPSAPDTAVHWTLASLTPIAPNDAASRLAEVLTPWLFR